MMIQRCAQVGACRRESQHTRQRFRLRRQPLRLQHSQTHSPLTSNAGVSSWRVASEARSAVRSTLSCDHHRRHRDCSVALAMVPKGTRGFPRTNKAIGWHGCTHAPWHADSPVVRCAALASRPLGIPCFALACPLSRSTCDHLLVEPEGPPSACPAPSSLQLSALRE
jgi:hypothetical protein